MSSVPIVNVMDGLSIRIRTADMDLLIIFRSRLAVRSIPPVLRISDVPVPSGSWPDMGSVPIVNVIDRFPILARASDKNLLIILRSRLAVRSIPPVLRISDIPVSSGSWPGMSSIPIVNVINRFSIRTGASDKDYFVIVCT